MPLTGKEMIKLLKKHGWYVVRIKESHHILAKDGESDTISVPVHGNTTLKIGMEQTILKQAGLK